jgi:hypothetical protein
VVLRDEGREVLAAAEKIEQRPGAEAGGHRPATASDPYQVNSRRRRTDGEGEVAQDQRVPTKDLRPPAGPARSV